jgi:hypothetical protein
MGSIQNKRASARGAPPQTYVPFIGGDGDNDEVLYHTRMWLGWVAFVMLIYILLGVLAVTIDIPKLHDEQPSWPGPFHDLGK